MQNEQAPASPVHSSGSPGNDASPVYSPINDNSPVLSPVYSPPGSVRSDELAPVRTGRESPPADLHPPLSSASSVVTDPDLVISKKEPLPPITGDKQDSEHVPVDPSPSLVIGTTMAGGQVTRETNKRPRITQSFRREIEQEEAPQVHSDTGFVRKHSTEQDKAVTVETQTEWSWLDDYQKYKKGRRSRASGKSDGTASDLEGDDDSLLKTDELDENSITKTAFLPRSVTFDITEDEDDSLCEEADDSALGPESTLPAEMKAPKAASRLLESRKGMESEMTFASESSIPYPPKDDEYGIPILHLSSESEDSDDDSEVLYLGERELDDEEREAGVLTTIGPPEILKYQKESQKQQGETDDVLLSDQDLERAVKAQQGGVFEGVCEFCGNPIKAFPSLEDQKYKPPDELYCCNDYQEFVMFMVQHPIQTEHNADKMIDIKPHPPYGSKQARRAAKEKAMARMREREMQRQQQAMTAAGVGGAGGGANFYQFARQMKTINYQLSSQKCMEEGWTLRPITPPDPADMEPDVYEPEPMLPPWAEGQPKTQRDVGLTQKFYEDGSLFVVVFADGTGTVYYPSGRHAISITSTEPGLFTYVVQDDTDEGKVLAVFEPNGAACSYFSNGMLRLFLDQMGGTELDSRGSKKRKWSWKDWKSEHVHAPPIQPITFAVTPQIGLRIVNQEHVTLTFTCRARRARFQVGSKLKMISKSYKPEPDYDEDEMYRSEVSNRVQSLFNKVANLLKFPNSPKLNKLPTPGHLSSRVQKLDKIREQQNERKAKRNPLIVSVN